MHGWCIFMYLISICCFFFLDRCIALHVYLAIQLFSCQIADKIFFFLKSTAHNNVTVNPSKHQVNRIEITKSTIRTYEVQWDEYTNDTNGEEGPKSPLTPFPVLQDTFRIEIVDAHYGHVFSVYAVVITPVVVPAVWESTFITMTLHIIQQYRTSTRTEHMANHYTEFPDLYTVVHKNVA